MEIIKKNWKIKLLSLVSAIFLWSYIIGTTNPTVSVNMTDIPIIYENMDYLDTNGLILDPSTRKTVNLSVSGQRSSIVNLTSQHIRVSANFEKLDDGVHTVRLNYSLPDGIVLEDYPREINATIDKIIGKELPVEVEGIGELPENYVIESTTISPELISIRGARNSIENVASLIVNLELDNLTSNTTANKEVRAVDANGNIIEDITFGQEFVNVSVVVELQKEVEVVPKMVGELSENYKLGTTSLNRSTALVQGPAEVINNITSIETAEYNISDLTETTSVPLKLSLPTDVRLVNPDTEYTLDIEIHGKSDKNISIPSAQVDIINQKDDLAYDIESADVKITLYGFSEDLEQINENNISVRVDVANLETGSSSVKPTVLINEETNSELLRNVSDVRIKVE